MPVNPVINTGDAWRQAAAPLVQQIQSGRPVTVPRTPPPPPTSQQPRWRPGLQPQAARKLSSTILQLVYVYPASAVASRRA
jgi:hypothetical protein